MAGLSDAVLHERRQVRRHLMARRVIPGSAEEIVADCVRTLISTA
jgi:hypothetical protein